MPRQGRIDAPGAVHHIICRGIERRDIFNDDDRETFVNQLGHVLAETVTPCYAWSLMPNHVHLLLNTGSVPIATVMRRLLTSYAVTFNRRHRRHGHLFQNRYKSILCQEDPYLIELVRYIHLNPLRAHVVTTLKDLDRYRYGGHSILMGRGAHDWQDIDTVLRLFGRRDASARRRYHTFIAEGMALGARPELVGCGLIRSAGGWRGVQSLRTAGIRLEGDERILGSSAFVESVLARQEEHVDQRYQLKVAGYGFGRVVARVAKLFKMRSEEILNPVKQPQRVRARSLVCYWAVKELGMPGIEVATLLGIMQPAVSRAVRRGEKIVLDNRLPWTYREMHKIMGVPQSKCKAP